MPEIFFQQVAWSWSARGDSYNLATKVENKITTTSGWYLNVSSACNVTVIPENWNQSQGPNAIPRIWCSCTGWKEQGEELSLWSKSTDALNSASNWWLYQQTIIYYCKLLLNGIGTI